MITAVLVLRGILGRTAKRILMSALLILVKTAPLAWMASTPTPAIVSRVILGLTVKPTLTSARLRHV